MPVVPAHLSSAAGALFMAVHPGMVRSDTGGDRNRFYNWHERIIIDRRSRSPGASAEALRLLGASEEPWARTIELPCGKGVIFE